MGDLATGERNRLGPRWVAAVVALSATTLLPGLGGSSRLTYHEAIVAQSAREMLARGAWLVPILDGRPWLEKPPLLHWLVLAIGHVIGGVTELAARLPSAAAATLLALAVATLGARRFGATLGGVAGCIQATSAWFVIRGRLADADMLLACLVAWTLVALDRLREGGMDAEASRQPGPPPTLTLPHKGGGKQKEPPPVWSPPPLRGRVRVGGRAWLPRLILLGIAATSLVKGIGFGAAMILAVMSIILTWDRDRKSLLSLLDVPALILAALITLAWPVLILAQYPEVLGQWTSHFSDRLADRPEVFAGRAAWWAYGPAVLGLTLPWTPFALVGAWSSFGRARRERGGADRLLWAWAVGPLILLSMATVKSDHYAIHALPPWSIWAAMGVARVGERLEARGRSRPALRRRLAIVLVGLGLAFGLGFWRLMPRFDRRGIEWGFYEQVSRLVGPDEPLVFLYDDWDRLPYPTPFGPVPHDLAVRLYYGNRPALWREGVGRWPDLPARPFAAIARDRDLEGLLRVGRLEKVAQGPPARWDRTFALYRVTPGGRDEATGREQQ
jgi:4-amino-4-deoxy-L-arabinose transferase-like glycosyltransferase